MKVSIFMFCRNGAKTIRRAIDSVLGQDYDDIEFIVQDGASTDGTFEILQEYGDQIDLRSEPDSCPGEGFFRALERCTGEIVGSCFVDEELLSGAVEAAVTEFNLESDIVAISRDALLTDLSGEVLGEFIGRPFSLEEYLSAHYVPHFSASFFRRQEIVDTGVLSRPWRMNCGEFELWARLLLQGTVRYIPGFASKYAIHDGQLSRNSKNVVELVKGRVDVLKTLIKRERHPLLDSSKYLKFAYENIKQFGNDLYSRDQNGAFIELVNFAREILANNEGNTPVQSGWSREIFGRLCNGCFNRGDLVESLEMASVGTKLYPGGSSFALLACKVSVLKGEYEVAKNLFNVCLAGTAIDSIPDGLGKAVHDIAMILESKGEIEKALEYWDRISDWDDSHAQSISLGARLKSPNSSLDSLLEAHDRWGSKFARCPSKCVPLRKDRIGKGGRLRVGISCSFWNTPTIKFQWLSFLNEFDTNRYTLIAYVNYDDGFRGAPGISELRLTATLSDLEFRALAMEDGLDILIELNGHSPRHRFSAMAMRCAPIQVSYLNYTATSGVREVDYLVTDWISCPEGEDPYYFERLCRLEGCFFCFNYDQDELLLPAQSPSIENGYVTFGCFSSAGKINGQQVKQFAEVLKRVEGSRLIIRNNELRSVQNREALLKQFTENGISEQRLDILEGLPRDKLLREYSKVDISLDTSPYNGGNTIAESLWLGVPMVTQCGDRFSSRYGSSLMRASGCESMVANNSSEYVDICERLACDESMRVRLRDELRDMMKVHGFSDTRQFAQRFSHALEGMVERYDRSRQFFDLHWGSCNGSETTHANLFRDWVFLTSMPRSGTWYVKYIFHLVDHRIQGKSELSFPPRHLRAYRGLGINAFHSHCSHWMFEQSESELVKQFQGTNYILDGFEFGLSIQREILALTEVSAKTVYIYRNPFDHCISMFRHLRDHRIQDESQSAAIHEMKSAVDYFRNGGLTSYLKQFYSHYYVEREGLASVKMVRYEDLKRAPLDTFSDIFKFSLGRALISREKEALAFAVDVVVPENLKVLERLAGESLGSDQRTTGESHMRGGQVGGWRTVFGDDEIELLKRSLDDWGIPIDIFDFGDTF